jgi:septal ring factor EnvC (AmiA/AmiB activator)
MRRADADVAAVVAEIAATDARIARLVSDRELERPRLQARLVEIYKLGQGRYLRLLLSTADLRGLGYASRTVAALAMSDRDRIARYERQLGELSAARQAQSSHQQSLTLQRAEAARAQAAAARAAAERTALVREIDRKRDLNARLASELQTAQRWLETTIRGFAAAGTVATLPIGPFRGALPWPTAGVVRRRDAALATADSGARAGIAIEAPEGSPVHAIHDGVVAYAGSFEGLGNLVILDHGAQTFSLYGHLMDMAVGRGVHLAPDETLGRTGSPPTGPPALYFELRVEGRPVDALQWLGSNVRR